MGKIRSDGIIYVDGTHTHNIVRGGGSIIHVEEQFITLIGGEREGRSFQRTSNGIISGRDKKNSKWRKMIEPIFLEVRGDVQTP